MPRTLPRVALVLALLAAGGLAAPMACGAPLRVEPIRSATGAPEVDEHLELARAYAPWIYHAVHATRGRQDIPAAVDFDGDMNGENSWENMPRFELVPTVLYAALQTGTHWFLTYHVYHPRDWSFVELGVHTTHEGDGENLQVVVEKASGRVVLLYTQAHYVGEAWSSDPRVTDGDVAIEGPLVLVDDDGTVTPDGRHAAVFVEWGGHGIHGLAGASDEVTIGDDGTALFADAGLVLRPARTGETVREPELPATGPAPYRLESTLVKLWPLLRDESLVGEGRLLDGPYAYTDARVTVGVPRYHEADRFSGPFGPDRGISPFAVDFDWEEGTLGALFFDPAARWAACVGVPAPWDEVYVDDPFGPGTERDAATSGR